MKKFKTASGEAPVLHRNSANLMQNMLDEVKNNITILPELQALIPALQPAEREQLKANILKEGCREALLIWQTTRGAVDGTADGTPLNVLIDGHNRYAICRENGVDFKVALREFPTLQAVRDFMIDNQLGRRNLTPEQMSYLRGLKYRNERQSSGRPVLDGAEDKTAERTQDRLAREFNVSPRTLHRDRDFSAGVDKLVPEIRQEILTGKIRVPKELVQAVGRTATPESPLLSLPELLAYGSPEERPAAVAGTTDKANHKTEKALKVIADKASQLNVKSADFQADCEELIALIRKVKTNVAKLATL